MQTLLRSVFRASPGDDLELLTGNAQELRNSRLAFYQEEHARIWTYIDQFLSDHNHVPDWSTLDLHFTQIERNPDVVNHLQILKSLSSVSRGDFKKRLYDKVEERKTREVEELFKFANTINRTGVEIKDEYGKSSHLYGYRDAITHVTRESLNITRPATGIRKEGEVTSDTALFKQDYERRRDDPNYGKGQLCGIQQIDDAVGGARKDQLWTHAASTGELKCLTGETLIQEEDTGTFFTVGELYKNGHCPQVRCLNEESWEFMTARIQHVERNAEVPIFKITTSRGQMIRTSGNHPFLTMTGWKKAENLVLGQDLLAFNAKWLEDEFLRCKREDMLLWEGIASVVPDGIEMTYDLSVPGPENFVANGFVVHNSTFAFNWVYNQAIYFGFSSCYFSLEMPYDQCQRIIYTMHSLHDDFVEARLSLGIQTDPYIPVPLNYRYIRDGVLPPNEEKFLFDYVLPDLEMGGKSGYYGKMNFRGYDPDAEYFRVSDIRARSETLYNENPFDLLIVDHVLLIDPKKSHRSTTESANEVVRDLKKLSEVFMSGEGMALLALFQISRQGKMRADKADGRYNTYDLSYSNEIERSSDIITASYLNPELTQRCRSLFQFLKARDDGTPPPFYVRVDWPTRRLFTCFESPGEDADAIAEEVDTTSPSELLGL